MNKDYQPSDPKHKFKIQEITLESGVIVKIDHNSKCKCKSCGAEIIWAVTKDERVIPVELVGFCRWDTHFITCPYADQHRVVNKNQRKLF